MTLRRITATPVDINAPVVEQLLSTHGLLPTLEIDDINGNIYIGGVLVNSGNIMSIVNTDPDGNNSSGYVTVWLGANKTNPTNKNYSLFFDTIDGGFGGGFADLRINTLGPGNISLGLADATLLEIGTRTLQRLNVPAGYGYGALFPAKINVWPNDGGATLTSNGESGQMYFWLDESGNNVKIKVKYSNGTTKTGTVALI